MVRFYVMVLAIWAGAVQAELNSLFPGAGDRPTTATPASLFSPSRDEGMFAALPDRGAPALSAPLRGTGNAPVDRLLTLIAQAEAGPLGYDAVNYGADIRPPRRPTQMTLGEIYAWIEDTPGQPHAIGRYQFIPPTLRRVARERGFGPETRFSPGVQDVLALVLLEDAGLSQFQRGEMERQRFMYNLARIWAGLPLPNGRSYYEGHAGNSASMSWAAFDGGMARIWPVGG